MHRRCGGLEKTTSEKVAAGNNRQGTRQLHADEKLRGPYLGTLLVELLVVGRVQNVDLVLVSMRCTGITMFSPRVMLTLSW